MGNNGTQTVGSKIAAALILIWIVGSFACVLYAMVSKTGWLVLVAMGQLLFLAGIVSAVAMIREKQNHAVFGGLFILVGGIMLVSGLILRFGSDAAHQTLVHLFPVFFGGVFLLVGLGGLLLPVVWQKRKEARYTTSVDAVCIRCQTVRKGKNDLIDPVYQITLNGEQHELDNHEFSMTAVPKIGETRTLLIDENDPEGYLDPEQYRKERKTRILKAVLFGAFALAGGMLLYLFLSGRLPAN